MADLLLAVRHPRVDGRAFALRVAAAAAGGCLAVHLMLLVVGGRSLLHLTVPMLALSASCSFCALRIWRSRCTDIELALMVCVSGAMGITHLMLAPMHHLAGGMGGEDSASLDLLMHLGVSLGILAGLIAASVLILRLAAPQRR